MNFRTSYEADLPLRMLDLGLHVAAAVALPGPWWLQWLPEALSLPLWLHGMVTNRMLPQSSLALRLHRLLHLRGRDALPALVVLLVLANMQAFLTLACVHVLAHASIDHLTHGEGWL